MLNRYRIKCLFMGFLCLTFFSAYADELPPFTQAVAENVYSFGDPSKGYFSMFVVTSRGVIVMETVNTPHAEAMLAAIQQITDKPVRFALHSHNHWDHAAGGQVFQDVGAKTVAHIEAYRWMKDNPHPDMALPNRYWKGSRKNIRLGDTTIELHYLGMNHGLGMTVFILPKQRIAYIADLVTPNRVLFTIVPDFNIGPFVESLKKIEQLNFDHAIYSHSHANVFEPKIWVTQTREFIEDVQQAITEEFQRGTPFTQIPQTIDLPQYRDWAMYYEWLPLNVWRIMLDGVMGPFPWQPDHRYKKAFPGVLHRHHH